jgi:hypothetical protein
MSSVRPSKATSRKVQPRLRQIRHPIESLVDFTVESVPLKPLLERSILLLQESCILSVFNLVGLALAAQMTPEPV